MVYWGQLFHYTSYCTKKRRYQINRSANAQFSTSCDCQILHTHTHTQDMGDVNLLTRKISNSTMLSLHYLCNLSQYPTTNNIGNNWHNRAIWQLHIIVGLNVSPRTHPYWYWNLHRQTTQKLPPPPHTQGSPSVFALVFASTNVPALHKQNMVP